MHYLELLQRLHEEVQPAGYLEIGVAQGDSLRLSRAWTVAIDPAPQPHPASLLNKAGMLLYVGSSDDFFAQFRPETMLGGAALDLAFIDGLHEFTQVVRDLEHVERWGRPETVVAIHDVLPRDVYEATRAFHAGAWTGDVWRLVPFLAEQRPDLRCWLVRAAPTGMLVVTGLDPAHPGMSEAAAGENRAPISDADYDEMVAAFMRQAAPISGAAFLARLRRMRRPPRKLVVHPSRAEAPRRVPEVWMRDAELGGDYFAYMGVSPVLRDSPAEVVWHEEALVDATTGLVFDADGDVIRANLPIVPDSHRLRERIALVRERIAAGEVIERAERGPFALLATPRHDNYFHFLFDDLGRLGFYEGLEPLASARFPIPPPRRWQRDLFALAGIDGRTTVLPPGVVALHDVWIAPRGLARIEEFRSRAFDRVRVLADRVPDAAPGPRRIYISRQQTRHRRLRNEHEARRLVERRGFAVVEPETMAAADQIRLFRGAEVVLGVFGAGLANAAFMPPGGALLEIAPSRPASPPVLHNAIFATLAGFAGLRYGLVSAPSASVDDATHDFDVPLAWLEILLDRMLEATAPMETTGAFLSQEGAHQEGTSE